MTEDKSSLIELAAGIVASYVEHNSVTAADLPELIQSTHAALAKLREPEKAPTTEAPIPAISIRKSVTPDFIVCLEDGKQFKSLKRHLMTSYNMTPDQYRVRWGLSAAYPMVAPNYAKQRSELAKHMRLGQKGRA
ncbi:MucR family transcriptional regulator [Bosea sp. PAMC 26642]|uniref:MucR family transcriptional regulator n=1 Tax=Bosea sp. (strain PAMC 26642) TaxID=1792307 RepID=UPI0007701A3C|nr:MucR family transcriptional regulator [Bosea sp. PAMC 26642]AMJ59365.1 MucR family transcriptional regulator [Bosea sp. PAMC 26642]